MNLEELVDQMAQEADGDPAPSREDRAPLDFLGRAPARGPVLFLGGRGAGDAVQSALATWSDRARAAVQGRGPRDGRAVVVPLGVVHMSAVEPSLMMRLVAPLGRLFEAVDREGGDRDRDRRAPWQAAADRSEGEAQRAWRTFVRIAAGFDGGALAARRPHLDLEAYTCEAEEAARDVAEAPEAFAAMAWAAVGCARRLLPAPGERQPFLVVPVSFGVTAVGRGREVAAMLRVLAHPRVLWLMDAEFMVESAVHECARIARGRAAVWEEPAARLGAGS